MPEPTVLESIDTTPTVIEYDATTTTVVNPTALESTGTTLAVHARGYNASSLITFDRSR